MRIKVNKEISSFLRSEGEKILVNEETQIEVEDENGCLKKFSVLKSPVKNEKGNNVSFNFFIQDVTEIKKLEFLSFYDSLTGLHNRNFFEEEVKRVESGRFNPIGLIICDLDNLKSINDSFGHKEGDSLLIAFSKILKASFRKSDIISRIGGDEFAVLLFDATKASMKSKIRHLQEACRFNNISVSVGLSISDNIPVVFPSLFAKADEAMYEEKKSKRRQ